MHLATLFGVLGITAGMTAPAVWAAIASASEGFARMAGTMLATSLWQSAVIVCGLEICLRVMPRISAAYRFAIWAAGFGVAALLSLAGLVHLGAGAASVANSAETGTSAGPLLQLDARWGLAIAGLWLAASVARGTSLAMHSIRLRRLWKAALPADSSETLTAALKDVRGGRVSICTTEISDRPSVIGFLAPRILIPEWLMKRLTATELEQIVLHEAEHLRRGDDWTNLLQKLWLVIFPLNPALAWMERHLCREREMACDEGVVRITNAPRAYAACLASLAERGLERRAEALSLGAWHRRSELAHRVHGILLRKGGLNKAAAGAVLGVVGCALVAGSVEMARVPQLVAFVPAQASLAMTPQRQREMTAMLARERAEAKSNWPAGFHAVQAKAVLPVSALRVAVHDDARRRAATTKKMAPTATQESEQIAMVEAPGDRVRTDAEQQWVVMAAWEEVRTVSQIAISDYDSSAATDGAPMDQAQISVSDGQLTGQASKRLPNQMRNYSVTQLILRVVPANSISTQPAAGSMRGGWFVFQL